MRVVAVVAMPTVVVVVDKRVKGVVFGSSAEAQRVVESAADVRGVDRIIKYRKLHAS